MRRCGIEILLVDFFACGGDGPRVEAVDDQAAAVGSELLIVLQASSKFGGQINYAVESDAPSEGELTQRPDGSALFAWTPTVDDIGTWTFDFRAADSQPAARSALYVSLQFEQDHRHEDLDILLFNSDLYEFVTQCDETDIGGCE